MMSRSKKQATVLRPNRGRLQRKRASVLRTGPARDPKYLAWIRQQLCTVGLLATVSGTPFDCSAGWVMEAAHTGIRGLRQKASDHEAIPLCAGHHRLRPDSHHRMGKNFFRHHGLNRLKIIAALRKQYEQEKTK